MSVLRLLWDALRHLHGWPLGPVDGIFGPKLVAAVKVLQDKHGLTADGIIGPKTWRALKSL
ncbi:MAG: peptidoglycan-binding domain-containing protein [Pedococcus sp.]